jgi:hypothetical protein
MTAGVNHEAGPEEEAPAQMEHPNRNKTDVGEKVEEVSMGQITDKITSKGKLDVAAEFLRLHEGENIVFSKKEARRVLWKIDLRLIPLMTGTVVLTAVDVSLENFLGSRQLWTDHECCYQKIMISNAAVYGMEDALNLHGQQYSWCEWPVRASDDPGCIWLAN